MTEYHVLFEISNQTSLTEFIVPYVKKLTSSSTCDYSASEKLTAYHYKQIPL